MQTAYANLLEGPLNGASRPPKPEDHTLEVETYIIPLPAETQCRNPTVWEEVFPRHPAGVWRYCPADKHVTVRYDTKRKEVVIQRLALEVPTNYISDAVDIIFDKAFSIPSCRVADWYTWLPQDLEVLLDDKNKDRIHFKDQDLLALAEMGRPTGIAKIKAILQLGNAENLLEV
eukprot:GHVS01103867.1.p1 GENE.GHVS01103867.1~~GHVS01103867.1.p1  ORF type:complete len:174 (-),score=9.29 GHVS01103867.1:25-546(-)